MSKKKIFYSALALTVAIIIIWIVTSQQPSGVDNSERHILIANFTSGGWGNVAGMTMAIGFNITLQNNESHEIDGLALEVKRDGIDNDPYNITRQINSLSPGKTEFHESLDMDMQRYFDEFYDSKFACTLKNGQLVLDESVIEITYRQF